MGRRKGDLPPELGDGAFSTVEATALGISRGRIRNLDAPFRGVRSIEPIGNDIAAQVRAFAPRLAPSHFFSHRTAALLWGMPLPGFEMKPLHVSVPRPGRAPTGRGIVGHQLSVVTGDVVEMRGLPVASAPTAWAQLAETLPLHDAVAAAEYLITVNPFERRLPLATIEQLHEVTTRRAGTRGHQVRLSALRNVREGAFSRPETLVRLLLEWAGLPPALINIECFDSRGKFLAMPDLSWPEYKVALEYEGKHHSDVAQFRADIGRIERLVDDEWLVIKASAIDLFDRPRELVERVARRLQSRGWPGRAELRLMAAFER